MVKVYLETELENCAEILKQDGVLAVPTDTVYGLCARIGSPKAEENLRHAKGRKEEHPLPIMCANKEDIFSVADVEEKGEKLIDAFMPGAITLIFPTNYLPSYINGGMDTVAIRMAPNEIIKELIEKVGEPLLMTSANQSGNPPCKSIEEIQKECPAIDGILEGNPTFEEASTIVDCTKGYQVVRLGPISKEQIQSVLEEDYAR